MKRPNPATRQVISDAVYFNHADVFDIHKIKSRAKRKPSLVRDQEPLRNSYGISPSSSLAYPQVMKLWKGFCTRQAQPSSITAIHLPVPPIKKLLFLSTMSPHPAFVLQEILDTLKDVSARHSSITFGCQQMDNTTNEQESPSLTKSKKQSNGVLISDQHGSLLFKRALERLSLLKPSGSVRNIFSFDDEEIRSCHKLWHNFLSHAVIGNFVDSHKACRNTRQYFIFGQKTIQRAVQMCTLIRHFSAAVDILQIYPKVLDLDIKNRKLAVYFTNTLLQCFSGYRPHVDYDQNAVQKLSPMNTRMIFGCATNEFRSVPEALYRISTTLYGSEYQTLVSYVSTINTKDELTTVYQTLVGREFLGNELTQAFLHACARLPEAGVSETRSMAYSIYKICAAKQSIAFYGSAQLATIEALGMVTAAHGLAMETFLTGLHIRQYFGRKKLRNIHLAYLWSLVSSGELYLAIKKSAHLLSRRRITDTSIVWVILSECSWELALVFTNILQKYTLYRSERLLAMILFRCKRNPHVVLRLLQRRIQQDSSDMSTNPHALIKNGLDGNSSELNYRAASTSPYVLGVVYNTLLHDADVSSKCFHPLAYLLSTLVFRTLGITCRHVEIKTVEDARTAFSQYKRIIIPPPMLTPRWLSQWLGPENRHSKSGGIESVVRWVQAAVEALSEERNLVIFPFETLFCVFAAQQIHCYPHSILYSWIRAIQTETPLFDMIPMHEMPIVREYFTNNYDCHEIENDYGLCQQWTPKAQSKDKSGAVNSTAVQASTCMKSFYSYEQWKHVLPNVFDPFTLTPKDLYPAIDVQGRCKPQNKPLQIEDRTRQVRHQTILESRPLVYAQFMVARENLRCLERRADGGNDGIIPRNFFCDPVKETLRMLSDVSMLKMELEENPKGSGGSKMPKTNE